VHDWVNFPSANRNCCRSGSQAAVKKRARERAYAGTRVEKSNRATSDISKHPSHEACRTRRSHELPECRLSTWIELARRIATTYVDVVELSYRGRRYSHNGSIVFREPGVRGV
jgi:hypothetical protein